MTTVIYYGVNESTDVMCYEGDEDSCVTWFKRRYPELTVFKSFCR